MPTPLTKSSQALANNVLITRLKAMPAPLNVPARDLAKEYKPQPAIKVCVTTGLSRKETEKAGTVVRHAVTTIMRGKKWQRSLPAPGTGAGTAAGAGAGVGVGS